MPVFSCVPNPVSEILSVIDVISRGRGNEIKPFHIGGCLIWKRRLLPIVVTLYTRYFIVSKDFLFAFKEPPLLFL
jgi:hypothetical protein